MTVTSSNPQAKISNQQIVVKSKRTLVEAVALFTTDKKGTFTNTITINRRDLQFRHSIYTETGYWLQSQMPFVSVGYSYKWLLISTKVGYSFRLQEIDYGIGIGGKWSW